MDIARNKKKRTGKYASTSTRYKEPMTSIRHPKSNQKKKKRSKNKSESAVWTFHLLDKHHDRKKECLFARPDEDVHN
ncbi:hypothetical protein I7I48_06281 [Histoplasma ohiense]|nr:hypothetical protein I7I48_06281 [Histoplasma ohiense (nom. inval.)]